MFLKKMRGTIRKKYIIGIDEVGRGALAGPVVVVAAMICQVPCIKCQDGTLKDSKKLSAKRREAWSIHFKNHPGLTFAVARVYPRQIEKKNISGAANLAAFRAYERLIAKTESQGVKRSAINASRVFLDGGLYLESRKEQTDHHPSAKTIIKADETIAAVAIASIVAKVHRDRLMHRLARSHPGYGFEIHKGYGTKAHYAALRKHGPTSAHRLTFLKKSAII
jgi:ribonuclease HII